MNDRFAVRLQVRRRDGYGAPVKETDTEQLTATEALARELAFRAQRQGMNWIALCKLVARYWRAYTHAHAAGKGEDTSTQQPEHVDLRATEADNERAGRTRCPECGCPMAPDFYCPDLTCCKERRATPWPLE